MYKRQLLHLLLWLFLSCGFSIKYSFIGKERVPKIILNDTIDLFLKTAIIILVISNHNSFLVLTDKTAFVYFIWKMYLYQFSIGNGQPREQALCQLYRHTFVPCSPPPFLISRKNSKGSPYSITERRVSELIPVLGSQPVGDVSHKAGGRLPLLSARPAVTPATLKRAATSFVACWTEAQWVWTISRSFDKLLC